MTLQQDASSTAQTGAVLEKAGRENFPVAPFFLPPGMRDGLMAVYGFARLVDDVGDGDLADPEETARVLGVPGRESHPGEAAFRLALLDALDEDVERAFAWAEAVPGTAVRPPQHPLLRRLPRVIENHGLSREPFRNLIEANRVDQRVTRYATFEELRGYCRLSADPVGRLVLELAGRSTPDRVRRSDAVCTALQIVEHTQDIAEDRARGRVYLPQEDLERFGVAEEDLDAPAAGAALRELVAFQVRRARALLDEGAPLVGSVGGRLRVLLAGFTAGGYAALDAVAAAGYDVQSGAPRPGKRRLLRHAARTLARGR